MVADEETQRAAHELILGGEARKRLGWDERRCAEAITLSETSGPSAGYRQRVRLSWRHGPDGPVIGYKARGSHRVVAVTSCHVADPAINAALEGLAQAISALGSRRGEATLLAAREGVAWILRGEDGRVSRGGPERTTLEVDGRPLRVDVGGFALGNALVSALISRHVVRFARATPPGVAVELFAGSGTWTLALLSAGHEVVAYEGDGGARDAFNENTAHGAAVLHVADLLDTGIPEPPPPPAELVVLDPPRGGAEALMPWVRARGISRVLMISCDMATAFRDIALLTGPNGPYEVQQITAYDMFPQTGHQELVIELTRGSDAS